MLLPDDRWPVRGPSPPITPRGNALATAGPEGCRTSDAAVAADAGAAVGLDRAAVLPGMQTADTKARLIKENEVAIRRGVFGSPSFLVDGEPFWGSDRIALLAQP